MHFLKTGCESVTAPTWDRECTEWYKK